MVAPRETSASSCGKGATDESQPTLPSIPEGTLKRLLYMCEYPPSTNGGAPIILRRLLGDYDPKRLHVLCDSRLYERQTDLVNRSHLSCSHQTVPNFELVKLRPRRIFDPIAQTLNCLRVPIIKARAHRIVREEGIQAIFTVPWRCEFALAAYHLHLETGLPLYVFETDDWEEMNTSVLPRILIRKNHAAFLRAAEVLWLTSPAMIEDFRARFEVTGRFLFHFVDADRFPTRTGGLDPEELKIVYAGAINNMFRDCMEAVCRFINSGVTVGGRKITLTIYSSYCPPSLLGTSVLWGGHLSSEEVPGVLATADGLLVCVSFEQGSSIERLVRTSLYTKTIDYLASGTPVLVISPPYSAEVDYFKEFVTVVHGCTPGDLAEAFRQLVDNPDQGAERSAAGLAFVREHHGLDSVERAFLTYFRE